MREFKNPIYLGDSVYAGFDGYHVVLRLNSHMNESGEICMEDIVAIKLMDYLQSTFKFKKYAQKQETEGDEL